MCGIAGIINHQNAPDIKTTIHNMTAALTHRGPDSEGYYIDDKIAFGHRRLAVIDIAGGAQPIRSEDQRITLIFDGEIYNYKQLYDELTRHGHKFKTHTDSEVLLHLYEELDCECLRAVDGMYAFALFDARKQRGYLVRDRMGLKPIYYFFSGDQLIFGSELGALKQHPAMPTRLDLNALGDYFSLQYIPGPETIYHGVRKLQPGHYLEFQLESGHVHFDTYWHINYSLKTETPDFRSCAAEFRALFEKAVEKRLMSEVPIGVFLSGGIDSSAVATVAARKTFGGIDAFTVGFADPNYDERCRARNSAAAINALPDHQLRLHETEVAPVTFDRLSQLIEHFGEPYADASMVPTFLLGEFAKPQITVALGGDGADELFGGYERYLAMRLASRAAWLPGKLRHLIFNRIAKMLPDSGERTLGGRLRRFCKLLADDSRDRYFNLIDRCPQNIRRQLFGPVWEQAIHRDTGEFFRAGIGWSPGAADPIEQLSEIDLRTYLPWDILPKVDVSSMASGLEVRTPFLDRDIVEFSSRIPQKFKLHGNQRKWLIREAFRDILPEGIINAPKKGFGVPIANWLRTAWRDSAKAAIFDGVLCREKYLQSEPLWKLWQSHQSGERDHSYLLWTTLVLSLFMEKELERK